MNRSAKGEDVEEEGVSTGLNLTGVELGFGLKVNITFA